jgi:hypothetical protein
VLINKGEFILVLPLKPDSSFVHSEQIPTDPPHLAEWHRHSLVLLDFGMRRLDIRLETSSFAKDASHAKRF